MELSAAQKQAVGKLHELGASKRAGNGSRAKKPKGVLLNDPNAPAESEEEEEEEESDEEMEEEDKVDESMMLPAGL
jgi:U3 small nucleolar RNA-associated protein 14